MSADRPGTDAGTPRWDGDEQGAGVDSAAGVAAPLEELLRDMRSTGWVAEDPDGHLGPKLDAWLASRPNGTWRLAAVSVEGSALVIEVTWHQPNGRMRDLRADAYALIGSFAEGSAHIRQRVEGHTVVFDVVTGQPQTQFAPHGHVVVVRAAGPDVERVVGWEPARV